MRIFDARLKLLKITRREMRWIAKDTEVTKCETCNSKINGRIWYFAQLEAFICEECKNKFQSAGKLASPDGRHFRQDFLPVELVSPSYFDQVEDARPFMRIGGDESE